MFHKALNVKFKRGTTLEVTFETGERKTFDMSVLFTKYPNLLALKDRKLFYSGKLMGYYGIKWNDDMDIETETIYEEGKTVGVIKHAFNMKVACELLKARAKANVSQVELSKRTGIDQADISKIERGLGNPSIDTLNRLADALDRELVISFKEKE